MYAPAAPASPGPARRCASGSRVDDRAAAVLGRLDGRLAVAGEAVVRRVVHPDPQRQPVRREASGRSGAKYVACSSVVSAAASRRGRPAPRRSRRPRRPPRGRRRTSRPAVDDRDPRRPGRQLEHRRRSRSTAPAAGASFCISRGAAAGRHDRAALLVEPDGAGGQRELRPPAGRSRRRRAARSRCRRRSATRCSRPSGSPARRGNRSSPPTTVTSCSPRPRSSRAQSSYASWVSRTYPACGSCAAGSGWCRGSRRGWWPSSNRSSPSTRWPALGPGAVRPRCPARRGRRRRSRTRSVIGRPEPRQQPAPDVGAVVLHRCEPAVGVGPRRHPALHRLADRPVLLVDQVPEVAGVRRVEVRRRDRVGGEQQQALDPGAVDGDAAAARTPRRGRPSRTASGSGRPARPCAAPARPRPGRAAATRSSCRTS